MWVRVNCCEEEQRKSSNKTEGVGSGVTTVLDKQGLCEMLYWRTSERSEAVRHRTLPEVRFRQMTQQVQRQRGKHELDIFRCNETVWIEHDEPGWVVRSKIFPQCHHAGSNWSHKFNHVKRQRLENLQVKQDKLKTEIERRVREVGVKSAKDDGSNWRKRNRAF